MVERDTGRSGEPRYDDVYFEGVAWLDGLARAEPLESLGIVGHEAAKFTPTTERAARSLIRQAINYYRPRKVVSGECPLGGVDIWAREESAALGVPFHPYAPEVNEWEPPNGGYGFKARNIDIAKSQHVICVVVDALPPTYRGRRFDICYHCGKRNPPHVKSGGCWTAWRCPSREWVIVR